MPALTAQTSDRPHDSSPGAQTVGAAIASAAVAAQQIPFVWVTGAVTPRVRGLPIYVVTAAPGAESFVSWNWDGRRLIVQSDPFGLIPAYVYRRGHDVAVSTSIARLVHEGATLRIDRTALAVFLRLGFFVGDDTPFVEIRALPPGARLVWEDGQCDMSGGPYTVAPTHPSRDEAIGYAIDLTERAVARRAPTAPFAVPLSGGRDSRHILLALLSAGADPEFVVTVPRCPPAAAEDPRIASLVAAECGVRHVVIEPVGSPASREARKNVATSYCADEHAWFFPMLDYVGTRVPLVYEGIGGSLWTVGWLPQRQCRELWQSGRTRDVAVRMIERYRVVGERFLDELLTDRAGSDHGVAVERLAIELDRHALAPDPGKSFHFWNRLRRELALVPFEAMRRSAAVHTPLVDRELVEFLLSLQPELVSPVLSRADKSFHSDAIRRAFPRAAHLPFEADNAPHTDPAAYNRQLTVDVAKYLFAHPPGGRVMRPTFLWPRLAYVLSSRRYAQSCPWLANTALYLAQIEAAAS